MKIKVHEIEGNYYCAIDDVTRAKARYLSTSLSSKDEAINCHKYFRVFVHISEMLNDIKKASTLQHIRDDYPKLLDGKDLYEKQLFRCNGYSSILYSLRNGIYQAEKMTIHNRALRIEYLSDRCDALSENIEHFCLYNFKQALVIEDFQRGFTLFEGAFYEEENRLFTDKTAIAPQSTRNIYIDFDDAKTYLADVTTDDDFIMPDSEPTTPKTEPIAEQPTTEIISLTDETPLGEKERGNLHRIIHAMKDTLLDKNTKNDKGKQLFNSQNELIEHLANRYNGYGGVTTSNLKQLYAKLNKELSEAEKTFDNSL